jgi:hypothetical protein
LRVLLSRPRWSHDEIFFVSECATGYYGQDCSYKCGMCSKNETCNAETGTCYNGCMTGYTEPYCKSKYEGTVFSPVEIEMNWLILWMFGDFILQLV